MIGLSSVRIGRFHYRHRMVRYAATTLAAGVSLMRHFLAPRAPGLLPGGVATRPAARALIACPGSAQRLAAANARTLPRAVEIAVIAAATDAHLYPAALAVVEPIGRLAQRAQRLPPQALDSAQAGRHKGPAHCLP